jgi:hypothetical protein
MIDDRLPGYREFAATRVASRTASAHLACAYLRQRLQNTDCGSLLAFAGLPS